MTGPTAHRDGARGAGVRPQIRLRAIAFPSFIALASPLVAPGVASAATTSTTALRASEASTSALSSQSGLLLCAALAAVLGVLVVRSRRGHRGVWLAPLTVLDAALEAMRRTGAPLGLISVTTGDPNAIGRLASVVLKRLPAGDRLTELEGRGVLVVAPDSDLKATAALAIDLKHTLRDAADGLDGARIEVHRPDAETTATQLAGSLGR